MRHSARLWVSSAMTVGVTAIALSLVLLSPIAKGSVAFAQAACTQCPANMFCACINCTYCNSGSFVNQCMCYRATTPGSPGSPPVPLNTCSGQDGVCNQRCAKCVDTSLTTGRQCTSYAGCPGVACPADNCIPALRAIAGTACADCQITELEDRTGALPIRVRFERPARMPVELLEIVSGDDGRQELRIRNANDAGLVTLLLSLTFRAHNGEITSTVISADTWHMDRAFLAAGSTDTIPQMSKISHPSGIASIQIRPVYAEYDNGRRLAASVLGSNRCFTAQRYALVDTMTAALKEIEEAGPTREAVNAAILKHSELTWLQVDLDRGGVDAVLTRLRSPRLFQP
jgi:hypothetical protein